MHELVFLMRKIRHKAEPCSARNSPYTVFVHYNQALASKRSTHLAQWTTDRFGSLISYNFPLSLPVFQQQPGQVGQYVHTAAAQGGSRQLLFPRLNCYPLLSMWAIDSSIRGYYLGPYVYLTSATSFHPDTLQMVHLVFFPLQGEPLISVGAATKSIKAYCVLVQLSPLVER